jgi:hypothetical protein
MKPAERSHVLLYGFGGAHDELAGRLVLLSYRSIRADDLDSAVDALRRQNQPVRLMLFPAEAQFSNRGAALAQLSQMQGGLGMRAIVTGRRPDAGTIAALKRDGVRFSLWSPFHDSELRFVLNAALYDTTRGEVRPAVRVPASMMVRVKSGTGDKAALLYNLSAAGAFLETMRPNLPGGRVQLTIDFPDGPISIAAQVVFTNVPGNVQKPNAPIGMGVRFEGLAVDVGERIVKFIAERAKAYEL